MVNFIAVLLDSIKINYGYETIKTTELSRRLKKLNVHAIAMTPLLTFKMKTTFVTCKINIYVGEIMWLCLRKTHYVEDIYVLLAHLFIFFFFTSLQHLEYGDCRDQLYNILYTKYSLYKIHSSI